MSIISNSLKIISGRVEDIYRYTTAFLRRKPDYLVIGVQKSATSTLHNMLSQHPSISNPRVKELHYFDNKYTRSFTWYRSKFPISPSNITGEATPIYIYHPLVAMRIKKHLPNCKFIVILRNPIDRAYSQYHMNLKRKHVVGSFEESLAREQEKLHEAKLALIKTPLSHSHNLQVYSYLDRGLYAIQLEYWWNLFDPDRFLILSYENFVIDPQAEYNKICTHLCIPYFHNFIQRSILAQKYEPMSTDTRSRLASHFAPYNKRLFDLIGERFPWD